MNVARVAIMMGALLLAGCTSPVPRQRAALAAAGAPVAVSELDASAIQAGQTVRSTLAERDRVVAVDGGVSYAKLFRLDDWPEGSSVHVLGDCHCAYATSAYWLLPQVTLMDRELEPIATGPALALHNRVKVSYWSERLVIEGSMPLPAPGTGPLYLLVHTTPAMMQKGVLINSTSQQITTVGNITVPSGTNTYSTVIPAGPQGTFELTVLPPGRRFPDDAKRESLGSAALLGE